MGSDAAGHCGSLCSFSQAAERCLPGSCCSPGITLPVCNRNRAGRVGEARSGAPCTPELGTRALRRGKRCCPRAASLRCMGTCRCQQGPAGRSGAMVQPGFSLFLHVLFLKCQMEGAFSSVFMVALAVMETRQAGAAEHQLCNCSLPQDRKHVFSNAFWLVPSTASAWAVKSAFPNFSRSPRRLQILSISESANCPVNNRFPEAGRLISFRESKSRWSEIPSKLRKTCFKRLLCLNGSFASQPTGSTVCRLHRHLFFKLFASHLDPMWSALSAFHFRGGGAGHQPKAMCLFPFSAVGKPCSQEMGDA